MTNNHLKEVKKKFKSSPPIKKIYRDYEGPFPGESISKGNVAPSGIE
jgi:hypothetical protein